MTFGRPGQDQIQVVESRERDGLFEAECGFAIADEKQLFAKQRDMTKTTSGAFSSGVITGDIHSADLHPLSDCVC